MKYSINHLISNIKVTQGLMLKLYSKNSIFNSIVSFTFILFCCCNVLRKCFTTTGKFWRHKFVVVVELVATHCCCSELLFPMPEQNVLLKLWGFINLTCYMVWSNDEDIDVNGVDFWRTLSIMTCVSSDIAYNMWRSIGKRVLFKRLTSKFRYVSIW